MNIWKDIIKIDNKEIGWLHVADASISEWNIRKSDLPEEKEEIKSDLAQNIKQIGLQQIPVADSDGGVYIGGRRLVSHDINGEEWMLCEKRDGTPLEKLVASFQTNYQTKNVHYLDKGKAFTEMCKIQKITTRELADRLGVDQSYVVYRTQCWKYFSDVADIIKKSKYSSNPDKRVSFEKAKTIAVEDVPEKYKKQLIETIINDGMSYTEVKKFIDDGRAKEWELEQADVSERQVVEQKLKTLEKDLWDAEISVAKIKDEILKLRNLPPETAKYRKPADQLFKSEIRPGIPEYFSSIAQEFFRYYGGAFNHWELVACGSLSKLMLNEKEPFTEEMSDTYKKSIKTESKQSELNQGG